MQLQSPNQLIVVPNRLTQGRLTLRSRGRASVGLQGALRKRLDQILHEEAFALVMLAEAHIAVMVEQQSLECPFGNPPRSVLE